jgi:hypothetical protein
MTAPVSVSESAHQDALYRFGTVGRFRKFLHR